jgi:DNA-binding CsgD family transcriptional regulator
MCQDHFMTSPSIHLWLKLMQAKQCWGAFNIERSNGIAGIEQRATTRVLTVGGEAVPMGHLNTLTQRERDVLALVAHGQHNKEIARTLGIAVHTVEQHLKHIYQKLGIGSRVEAAILYWGHDDAFQHDGNPLYTAG